MRKKIIATAVCLLFASAVFAQKKEDERLEKSAKALQEIISGNGLHKHILDQAYCVLVYPGVKKVAIGIGGSYGRGEIVCRNGADMRGAWGAPAMYGLDRGSLGVQLGETETDFVLVVVSHHGVDQLLNGKTKLGADAAAAAGPSAATAQGYTAVESKVDILTYSRAKGLFAGVSLEGASMDSDNDANKALYGKSIKATDIVKGNLPVPAAAAALVNLLNQTSPKRI